MSQGLAARLADRAALHPKRVAIVEARRGRTQRTTYGELAARVAALAAGLEQHGIRSGDRVLLFVPMSTDLYVTLLAVLHLGGVAVFVDAWAGRRRLDAAVAAAGPQAFIGPPRAHLLRLASRAMRSIPVALMSGPALRGLERPGRARPPAAAGAETPALVTFTTGSTGRPRAASRSHGFLWAQHVALEAHLGITAEEVDLPSLPVFVLNDLAAGATSVLPDFDPRRPGEVDPARLFALIRAEGVTTTSGSPAFFERLAHWCAARRTKLPVRALFTGGAPVLPPLARLLADAVEGAAHVVYGSTEAEPIAGIEARAMLDAMERSSDAPRGGLCVGRPVAGISVRLVRPHDGPIDLGSGALSGWDVPAGDVGEVVVSGSHVLPGYLGDPEGDRMSRIQEGDRRWHRTGDAAWADSEGRLWLMGRVSRRVRRAGETWWSTAAEVRALAVPGVRHAAYTALPDHGLGERAVLCVEAAGGRLTPELERELRSALGSTPLDAIVALRRIPRDPRHASKTDALRLDRLLARSRVASSGRG